MTLNYSDSDVLLLTLWVEYGERIPQLHSVEYDWLGPYPT